MSELDVFSVLGGWRRTLSLAGRSRRARLCAVALALPLLGACDQLGIDTPQKTAERQVADAKAIGSACRHAMRAIEDCYVLNPKADKASVFAGWREMDEYMRENKLEGVAPVVPRPAPAASKPAPKPREDEDEEDAPEGKPGVANKGKSAAGH